MTLIFGYVQDRLLVETNDSQNLLTNKVKQTIDNVLLKRTYWESNVLDRPSDDQYDTTDAREFMQCAFVCAKQDNYGEALWWYRRAHMIFCGDTDAIIYDEKIQLTSGCAGRWDVSVTAKIVTDYGNADIFQYVADVFETSMSVIESIERMQTLRWGTGGWWELIDAERQLRKEQAAVLEELRESLRYDN